MQMRKENILLQKKYNIVAYFYDVLDYPWEREYKQWRSLLLDDLTGKVLEAGVGTGRNLNYYRETVDLTGIELSKVMLSFAEKRKRKAVCKVTLLNEDATIMSTIASSQFDWFFSSFMFCVIPEDLQTLALKQCSRVLKINGRFRILEIVYSKDKRIRQKQARFAPLVEKIYGARFDRNTRYHIEQLANLEITNTSFLKDDTHLLIEGRRIC